MSDIFLSYASKDRETAKALAGALEQRGWSVWWDRRIPTGRDYADVIETQLAQARCVIVLWSKASTASEWVKTEAADAKDRRLLVPVLIEPVKIPLEFRRIQAADLTDWKGETTHAGFSTLVGDLTGILGEPNARAEAPAPPEQPRAGVRAVHDDEAPQEPTPLASRGAGPSGPPDSREPPTEPPGSGRPAGLWPAYRVHIIAGAAAVALAAIVVIAVRTRGPGGVNVNNRNVAVAGSPSPTPPVNGNRNPPVSPSPNLDRGRRLAILLKQLNSHSERERRGTTNVLKDEYSSDPQAVEQALALLDESKVGELSPQGLINVLFFLNNTDDSAWTAESARKAEAAVAAIEKRPLGSQATEAVGKFKSRAAALKAKAGQ